MEKTTTANPLLNRAASPPVSSNNVRRITMASHPELPDIDLDDLSGPPRGEYPCLYFRDEVVWSPDGVHFALAYSITEASMGNEIGCIFWGRVAGGVSELVANPQEVYACCWSSPWCSWLEARTFVFKAQRYDGTRLHVPLVVVRFPGDFAVLPGTDNLESRHQEVSQFSGAHLPFTARAMREGIEHSV